MKTEDTLSGANTAASETTNPSPFQAQIDKFYKQIEVMDAISSCSSDEQEDVLSWDSDSDSDEE